MEYQSSYQRNGDNDKGFKRKLGRRKSCRFCSDKEVKVDFKNGKLLSFYISETAKVVPRRISGNCALHQRRLTTAIKRARLMALIPFTTNQR